MSELAKRTPLGPLTLIKGSGMVGPTLPGSQIAAQGDDRARQASMARHPAGKGRAHA